MTTIAFIGTGIMGKPMAANLQKAGHQLVFSEAHSAAPVELIANGGIAYPTVKAATEAAEVIILMVPNTPQVAAVLFADDGVVSALTADKMVIDMSSICPIETQKFAEKVKLTGAEYLDAPVSGGEVGAVNAALTIMVGGSESAFACAQPLLTSMGKNITLVGDNGAGQICKVSNQIIVALNIEAVSEALVFDSKAGADPARVREALMGGFANSKILEVHGDRMIKGTFDPGFKIALHKKDLNLALSGAAALGVSLPNTAKALELFEQCSEMGGENWDHSAMIRAIESQSNHEIRQ